MQLLLKNTFNAGYETADVVVTMPDNHVWGTGELQTSVFTVQTGVVATEYESVKLKMQDEGPTNFSAISQLPTFRSLSTRYENMKTLHRRKYQWIDGQLSLKSNAQER